MFQKQICLYRVTKSVTMNPIVQMKRLENLHLLCNKTLFSTIFREKVNPTILIQKYFKRKFIRLSCEMLRMAFLLSTQSETRIEMSYS